MIRIICHLFVVYLVPTLLNAQETKEEKKAAKEAKKSAPPEMGELRGLILLLITDKGTTKVRGSLFA